MRSAVFWINVPLRLLTLGYVAVNGLASSTTHGVGGAGYSGGIDGARVFNS